MALLLWYRENNADINTVKLYRFSGLEEISTLQALQECRNVSLVKKNITFVFNVTVTERFCVYLKVVFSKQSRNHYISILSAWADNLLYFDPL